MQNILYRYDRVATAFYNFHSQYFKNCSSIPYTTYALNISRVYFPKISYQNIYEPEYTSPKVKHNAPIVVSLILFTLYLSRQTVEK